MKVNLLCCRGGGLSSALTGTELAQLLTPWLYGWILIALLILPVQMFITAPYGRHSRRDWGPTVPNRSAWISMELVALLGMWWLLLIHPPALLLTWLAAGLWTLHYINRALIFPLRLRTQGKRMPLIVMLMAMSFNAVNCLTNGLYLSEDLLGRAVWMVPGLREAAGICLFVCGFVINVRADSSLLRLRRDIGQGYQIPRGGLFERVSCPNFFGEVLEWIGFAVLCWNLPALAFAVWTAANLIPRALAHHRWYLRTFNEYPSDRRAVIPYVL